MQFLTTNTSNIDLNIGYDDKQIPNTTYSKFFDDTLTWKTYIEMKTPNSSSACHAVRTIKPFVSQDILKMMYHPYFHSVTKYGINQWGNST